MTWHNCFTIIPLTSFHSKEGSYITLMVNYTVGVLKLGFCMARGISVTAASELKVHSIGQVLNLCLPCSNYIIAHCVGLNYAQVHNYFSLLSVR